MADNIVPRSNEVGSIGTSLKKWLKGWFKDIFVSGDITDGVNDVAVSEIVNTTGNQTVGGIKTFSSFPVTPSSAPTTDYQSANKKYVDIVVVNEQTDSYTLVIGDVGKIIDMNKDTANTLTVPKNSVVAFTVGTVVFIRQKGAGQTTIAPVDGDVTINNQDGLKLTGQYAGAALVKIDTNTWTAFGSLES